MGISKERYAAIKELGERLARFIEYVDPRFYRTLYLARSGREIRRALIQASNKAMRLSEDDDLPAEVRGLGQLLTLDNYRLVFMEDDGDTLKDDWWFANELLLIRVIEQLGERFVQANTDLFEEIEEESQNLPQEEM